MMESEHRQTKLYNFQQNFFIKNLYTRIHYKGESLVLVYIIYQNTTEQWYIEVLPITVAQLNQ